MEIEMTAWTVPTVPNILEKLKSFAAGCEEITKKENRRSIADFNKTLLTYNSPIYKNRAPLPEDFHDKPFKIQIGKRYARIVREGSVHCFVDLTNGDVLKAASWSKPAKHARGNIFDESNGLKLMGQYGPAYLR